VEFCFEAFDGFDLLLETGFGVDEVFVEGEESAEFLLVGELCEAVRVVFAVVHAPDF
jgi:hypothetical protein